MTKIKKKSLFKIGIILLLLFSLIIVSISCSKKEEKRLLKEGVYTEVVEGYQGTFEVTTVVNKDGEIVDVIIGDNSETEGLGSLAIDRLPELIKNQQSLDVDGVAGASITVAGILKSVGSSIEKAGGNLLDYGKKDK